MATFTELCNDVYTITNRPDLVDDTKLAVKAATLKAHQAGYWPKDIQESGIQFTDSAFVQQVDLYQLFPQFRSLKYFRRYDNSGTGEAKEFFKILTPTETLDSYGRDRTNICYLAGRLFNVKSLYEFQYALIGYYSNPVVTESGYNSWVSVDLPYLIVFEAARLLFKQIGFDEQSATFDKLVQEQMSLLVMNNTLAEGY